MLIDYIFVIILFKNYFISSDFTMWHGMVISELEGTWKEMVVT